MKTRYRLFENWNEKKTRKLRSEGMKKRNRPRTCLPGKKGRNLVCKLN
jgi:hypothetical protein